MLRRSNSIPLGTAVSRSSLPSGSSKLAEWGALAGGLDDAAAAQALRRLGEQLEKDGGLRRAMDRIDSHLSNI